MEELSQKKEVIYSKFKSFCKHGTLHGFYYFYKSSKWTIHLLWSSIVISSLILCAFLSQMIWQKFVADPTFTVVESTRYSISDIPFPAVILCDTEIVYGPRTENITAILYRRGYNEDQVMTFYRSLLEVRRGVTPDTYLLKMHALLDDLGYSYHTLTEIIFSIHEECVHAVVSARLRRCGKCRQVLRSEGPQQVVILVVSKPCDILLLQCVWRSKIFNCKDLFRKVYTFHGFCCQFDLNYFRSRVKGISYISGSDITEGLELKFNGDYVTPGGETYASNVLLYLFDHKDYITILDGFITLSSRTYYDVNLDVWAIDSSENVKGLSINDRKCLLNQDTGADFYQGCLTTAVLQEVADNCRCLPFNYKAAELQVADYDDCSWEGLFCVYSTIDKTLTDMKTVIVDSGCYQRCDYVQYDTKVKYIPQINQNSKADNSSRILIHFADSTCMKYRREVIYSWDQMLANLGGIFGLCVGGSIISVIELVWFFIDILYTLVMPTKKSTQKKLVKKDFVAKLSQPLKFRNNYGEPKLAFVY